MIKKMLLLSVAMLVACGGSNDTHTPAYKAASPAFESQPVKRCINMASALEAPPGENWGYTFRKEDFYRIHQAGFDSIRVPIKWSSYTGAGPAYKIDPRFLTYVERLVNDAIGAGLTVIINVHHFDEFNQYPERETARLTAIWRQLSDRFVGGGDKLIFELINEPHFDDMPDGRDLDYKTPFGIEYMNTVNANLVKMIRRTQPDRWLILGSSQWGSHYPLTQGINNVRFNPDYDPRVITTFHYYEPIEFSHQNLEFVDYPVYPRQWGTQADYAAVDKVFAEVAEFQRTIGKGMPVLLGEFGAGTGTARDQRADYFEALRRASEQNGFGWCAFEFGGSVFGMFDPDKNRWDGYILEALMAR